MQNICDGYTLTSTIAESANLFNVSHSMERISARTHASSITTTSAVQFGELQAYTSSCPSLSNLVTSQTTLTSLASGGCGPTGAFGTAKTSTGSRCNQVCSSTAQRQRGGVGGPVECRLGEWVNSATSLSSGAIVCGAVCPAVTSTTADPTQCVQTVANASFTDSAATGAITDWYPTWRLYKGGEWSSDSGL